MAIGGEAISSALTGTLSLIAWLVGGALLIIGAFIYAKKRKEGLAFNIPVMIFIPRSDNKTRDIILAKGGYFKSQAVGGITTFIDFLEPINYIRKICCNYYPPIVYYKEN